MSLPLRERGLKCFRQHYVLQTVLSLPLRERGLKLPNPQSSHNLLSCRSPCGSVG